MRRVWWVLAVWLGLWGAPAWAEELRLVVQVGQTWLSPLGDGLLAVAEGRGLILTEVEAVLIETQTGRELRRTPSLAEPKEWLHWQASAERDELVGLSSDGRVVTWRLSTLAPLREERLLEDGPGPWTLSPSSRRRTWPTTGIGQRINNPLEEAQWPLPPTAVWAPWTLSEDGRWVLFAAQDMRADGDQAPHAKALLALVLVDRDTGAVSDALTWVRWWRLRDDPLEGFFLVTDADGAPVLRLELTHFQPKEADAVCWWPLEDRLGDCEGVEPAPDHDRLDADAQRVRLAREGIPLEPIPPIPEGQVLLPGLDTWLSADGTTLWLNQVHPTKRSASWSMDSGWRTWARAEWPYVSRSPGYTDPPIFVRTDLPAGGALLRAEGDAFIEARCPELALARPVSWASELSSTARGPVVRLVNKLPESWMGSSSYEVRFVHAETCALLGAVTTQEFLTQHAVVSASGERAIWLQPNRNFSGFSVCELTLDGRQVERCERLQHEPWISLGLERYYLGQDDDTLYLRLHDGRLLSYRLSDGVFGPGYVRGVGDLGSVAQRPGHDELLIKRDGGGEVLIVDAWTLEPRSRLDAEGPLGVRYSPDGRFIITTHWEDVKLWDADTGALLATLVLFDGGDWAVIDPQGRFDRSRPDLDGLHFVLESEGRMETLGLAELERYYYEPGLLQKILDPELAPRPVVGLDASQLPPRLRWRRDGERLQLTLEDRGGGYGRVALFVDGLEVAEDVRPEGLKLDAASLSFEVDLEPYRRFIGAEASLSLQAWSASERVSDRGGAGRSVAPEFSEDDLREVDLYAIIVGTHRYDDPSLSLDYADDDALAMAAAIRAGGEALLGEHGGAVQVTVLSTAEGDDTLVQGAPSQAALAAAMAEVAEAAGPEDMLLVYFSGHGVSRDGAWHYPWPQARRSDLGHPDLLAARALSQDALMDMLRAVPARKRLLILDTCESGGVAGERSGAADDQKRALAELEGRMGMTVLAGAPSAQSAFEDASLGHGLLTYALLDGLRGAAPLREGRYWEVEALVGHVVEEVPRLAAQLDLEVQSPLSATPEASRAWWFGAKPEDIEALIPLRAQDLPLISGGQLIDSALGFDSLGWSAALSEALYDRQRAPDASFRWSPQATSAQAWRLGGSYQQDKGRVTVELTLAAPDGAGGWRVQAKRAWTVTPEAGPQLSRCAAAVVQSAALGLSATNAGEEQACQALSRPQGESP